VIFIISISFGGMFHGEREELTTLRSHHTVTPGGVCSPLTLGRAASPINCALVPSLFHWTNAAPMPDG